MWGGIKKGGKVQLVIYFKDKIERTASGYSPGGAVLLWDIILDINEDENCLKIKAPDAIELDEGSVRLEYGNGMIICLEQRQILRIEL